MLSTAVAQKPVQKTAQKTAQKTSKPSLTPAQKAVQDAARKAAQEREEQERAEQAVAVQAANEAAEKAAREVAEKAAREVAERKAQEAAIQAEREAAEKAALEEQARKNSILPKAGDFAIGVDATPFLKYVGGFFYNNSTNTDIDALGIHGKYFVKDAQAIRANLKFGIYTDQTNNDVEMGLKKETNSVNDFNLNLGYEWRRGSKHLQAFYGIELLGGYNSGKSTKEIADTISGDSQELKTLGATISAGLGVFAGLEYFVAPKISVGAEVGFGAKYSMKGNDEITTEVPDPTDPDISIKETIKGASSTSIFTTPRAAITVTIYF
ncbi:hypothetical protein FACS1894195_4610 [Bacteroidia bacterium]|nr:hypothetical protein FACS1894195_4610 [Bacteroidia bacterium]